MGEPIRKPRDLTAPTPQNTPANASNVQQPSRDTSAMDAIQEQGGLGALANNPALVSLIQGRLGSLVGKSSGYIDSLPQVVKDRLAALKALRLQNTAIEAEFQRDLLELEKKFYAKQLPLYEHRAKIIAGEVQPTEKEIEIGRAALDAEKEFFDEDEDEDDDNERDEDDEDKSETKTAGSTGKSDEESDVHGIPDFWLTALQNLPGVCDTLSERDDEVLQYLLDIRLKYLDKPGFALEFEFADNAAFTNRVLTKTYYYHDEVGPTGDFMYDHAEGTDIKWTSPEANVTVHVEKRKQRNKHTKATRVIEKTIPEQSFFNFFTPPEMPDGDDDEYDEEVQDELEMDFDLGELIKEKLIPRAIDWYTGKALEYEGINGDDDAPEDDDLGDEDDADDDDDDADDDEQGAGSKKEAPPECKQQ